MISRVEMAISQRSSMAASSKSMGIGNSLASPCLPVALKLASCEARIRSHPKGQLAPCARRKEARKRPPTIFRSAPSSITVLPNTFGSRSSAGEPEGYYETNK